MSRPKFIALPADAPAQAAAAAELALQDALRGAAAAGTRTRTAGVAGDQSYSYSYSYSLSSEDDSEDGVRGPVPADLALDAAFEILHDDVLDSPVYLPALRVLRALALFDGADTHGAAAFWALVLEGSSKIARDVASMMGTEAVAIEPVGASRLRHDGEEGEESKHHGADRLQQLGLAAPVRFSENAGLRAKAVRHLAALERHIAVLERQSRHLASAVAADAAAHQERMSKYAQLGEGPAAWLAMGVPQQVYHAAVAHHTAALRTARSILSRKSAIAARIQTKLQNMLLEAEVLS